LEWLHDKVFGVRYYTKMRILALSLLYREAAVNCIKNLTEILGGTWAEKVLFPKIAVLQNNACYLHRQTILFTIIVFLRFLSGTLITTFK
jgi:hypothetical protein